MTATKHRSELSAIDQATISLGQAKSIIGCWRDSLDDSDEPTTVEINSHNLIGTLALVFDLLASTDDALEDLDKLRSARNDKPAPKVPRQA